jgi:ATP-dependent helicase HrpB
VLPLPVDPLVPAVLEAARHGNVVVLAPPGSGKTTRIPPSLLALGRVVVLEPRRIATRMAAARVAEEQRTRLGGRVGYQVRFESRVSATTRLQYVTEGVLVRRLLDDPTLGEETVVVLDEFHERHLQGDLALAWLLALQQSARPDLRLVIMSATLDPSPLAARLGARVLEAAGRRFPVEIEYEGGDRRPLEQRVAGALRRALDREASGDVLVFLPGMAEIRRAMEACAGVASLHDVATVALHGDLPLAEQSTAILPGPRRKVIFSTNVAESSITVEGVTVVVDSGLARRARVSPWSGLSEVGVEKISQASAEQRAGRAGRVRPGRCVRLYARHDFERRPREESPEIHRVDLSDAILALRGAGLDPRALPWLEPPSPPSLAQAEGLLRRLGALDGSGRLTGLGERMLALPLHPRLARMIVEGELQGIREAAIVAAALLSERDIRRHARGGKPQVGSSDLLALMEAYADARRGQGGREYDRTAVSAVRRTAERLGADLPRLDERAEKALARAVLVAWPDRVARRSGERLLLASGGSARLAETSVVREAEWLVAIDAEERGEEPLVRIASELEVTDLLALDESSVRETEERVWNEAAQRVEMVRRLSWERLTIDESREIAPRDQASRDLLMAAAVKRGLATFVDLKKVDDFLHRVAFLRRAFPERAVPEIDVEAAFRAMGEGAVTFAELRERDEELLEALSGQLGGELRRLLERAAPTHVPLPGRRRVAVHYGAEQAPWIASRLQDFFGLREGPRVGEGRVALVLHLLAPNQRAVQITTDLAGFWVRTWPQVRKELSRRYPRHPWPEKP